MVPNHDKMEIVGLSSSDLSRQKKEIASSNDVGQIIELRWYVEELYGKALRNKNLPDEVERINWTGTLLQEFKKCGNRAELARDSGVWVHCIGEYGAISNLWMAGIECNIIEGATGDILMISDGTDRFAIAGRGRPHEEQKHVFYFDALNGVDREKKA